MDKPGGGHPLTGRASSLFDIQHHRIGPTGSSIISFACEPKSEGDDKPKTICYENTYKMEPPTKFRPDLIKPIIEEILINNLQGRKYDPLETSFLTKTLAEDIKVRVKELNFIRYKLVSVVMIGQKFDQGVRVGSRFLWDPERDNFASASFDNKYLYAVGMVYGVYYE